MGEEMRDVSVQHRTKQNKSWTNVQYVSLVKAIMTPEQKQTQNFER